MKLTFLGTRGQIELRSRRHRMHASLMVAHGRSRVMVDCGLDWAEAVWRLRPRPHAIVLTHAHPDHAGGLKAGAPCAVYATAETWNGIRTFGICEKDRHVLRHRRPCEIAGIMFEAFPLEHSIRAPAVCYRISAAQSTILYAPDVAFIRNRCAVLSGVNVYIGDGASVRRPLVRRRGRRLIGHASVSDQLAWCREAGIRLAIITHCGSGIVGDEASAVAAVRDLGEMYGVTVAIANDHLVRRLQ